MPTWLTWFSRIILLGAVSLFATPAAFAQKAEYFQSKRADYKDPLGAGGYDVVAYQTQKAAVPGNADFRVSWKGAEWHFASAENRELFVKTPEKFAPQFGGYCAFAVAHGSTAAGDPKIWSVVDGKLYLNLDKGVQSSWQKNQASFIQRAEQNWPKILGR